MTAAMARLSTLPVAPIGNAAFPVHAAINRGALNRAKPTECDVTCAHSALGVSAAPSAERLSTMALDDGTGTHGPCQE
jgi:hypothetical protein